MSARGVLLKCDISSSFDEFNTIPPLPSPRSPKILLNDHFDPFASGKIYLAFKLVSVYAK